MAAAALLVSYGTMPVAHAEFVSPGSYWPGPTIKLPLAKPLIRMQVHPANQPVLIDGQLDEWNTAVLRNSKQAASFWFQYNDVGLQIAARMPTLRPEDGETLRVRISLVPSLTLPAIGWPGTPLQDAKTCKRLTEQRDSETNSYLSVTDAKGAQFIKQCSDFYRINVSHQQWIKSVFQSEYVFDGQQLRTRTPNYDPPKQYDIETDTSYAVVDPAAETAFSSATIGDNLQFEWQLPWNSLPLSKELRVEQIYLQVERCNVAQRCLGILPVSAIGERLPLSLRLSQPRQYQVSACNVHLLGMYRNGFYPGYFRPQHDLWIHDVIALATPFGGYFRGPDMHRRSPELTMYRYSESQIGNDEFICGPLVAHRIGHRITYADQSFNDMAKLSEIRRPRSQAPRPLLIESVSDQLILIMEPPDYVFSSTNEGQGGAEGALVSTIWLFDRSTSSFTKLHESAEPESCGQDLPIESVVASNDLRKLVITRKPCTYGEEPDLASVETSTLCFNEKRRAYLMCAD